MLFITPGSHALRIIKTLLLVGEFPFRSLRLLGDERTLKQVAVRLTEYHDIRVPNSQRVYHGKLLTISGKSKLKTMRLSRAGFDFLQQELPTEFQYYLSSTYNNQFHGYSLTIERNHRLAEIMTMFMVAGIECRPYLNPGLQKQTHQYIPFHEPAFYSSKYLKGIGLDGLNKTKYIRMNGALFYESGYYAVFNSRDSVMKWMGEGEKKGILEMASICWMNFFEPPLKSAILLGYDYEVAYATIDRMVSGDKDVQIELTGYNKVHFIPMDEYGIRMLHMMTTPRWQDLILYELFEEDQIMTNRGRFEYDALVNQKFNLSFLDGDILKLVHFRRNVLMDHSPYEIFCFDIQVDFIKKLFGDEVMLHIIPFDEFYNDFSAKRESLL